MNPAKLAEIQALVDRLQALIQEERNPYKGAYHPHFPGTWPSSLPPTSPFQPVASCPKCSRAIYQVDGYVCPSNDCPTQIKAT